MANYYTPEVLQDMLDRVKQRRLINDPSQASKTWEQAQPQQLTYQIPDSSINKTISDQIMANNDVATATSLIMAENKANKEAYLKAQRGVRKARHNYVKPDTQPGQNGPTGSGASGDGANAGDNVYASQGVPFGTGGPVAGHWGANDIPQVQDIPYNQLNPHGPMTKMNFHGVNYTVNKQVAPIFQSFLTDLWQMGYHPKIIQGYNVRNIKNSSKTSLHSYGFAIDIDPGQPGDPHHNADYWDSNHADDVYALPKSVGALAKKYGLSWGGTWDSHRDYMHFSVHWNNTW